MLRLVFAAICVGLLLLAIVQTTPRLTQQVPLQADELQLARQTLTQFQQGADKGLFVADLDARQLTALAASFSDIEAATNYQFTLNNGALTLVVERSFSVSSSEYYLSVQCVFADQDVGAKVQDCTIGKLSLPGSIGEMVVTGVINTVFGERYGAFFERLIAGTSIAGDRVTMLAQMPVGSANLNEDTIPSASHAMGLWQLTQAVTLEQVNPYVTQYSQLSFADKSMANWLFAGLQMAQLAPNGLAPHEENTAALWSLAIVTGERQFAGFLGDQMAFSHIKPISMTLNGRRDLAQHFVFSVVLYLAGNAEIALRVGEMKEYSDSLAGGSGYSFADLAADKAGLKFAEFATTAVATAKTAHCVLTGTPQEALFFPYVNDLPEGIRNPEFVATYGDRNSPQYASLEAIIDNRLVELPVYQPGYIELCGGN